MRFLDTLTILEDMRLAALAGTIPTIKDIIRKPSLLLQPSEISRIFMAHLWGPFSAGIDENSRAMKIPLITPNASGTVLEIGPGYGHSIQYFDYNKVTKYIALEPNTHMHSVIRGKANAAGFTEDDGSLLILSAGVEDMQIILKHVAPRSVDTILSILALCSLPEKPHPAQALEALIESTLAPGGQLLFYEHVLSPREDVSRWQSFWSPIWCWLFDGCRLNRPSHLWVREMKGMWREEESKTWTKDGEPEEHLFWHQVGRYVKN